MTHVCDGTLSGCFGCATIARRLADVRAVMTLDDRLDDVARARVWSKIDDALALRASHRRVGWRWPAAIAAAAAVAAAIAIVARARAVDDGPRVLSAPPDVTVTASLGPHVRAAIVGPAQLAVTSSIGEITTVRLETGTFYAQFDGGPGRALRVEAPRVVVDVVGTLFAIEAAGTATCVSVAHGRVRVTTATGETFVGARQRWCTGDGSTAPIEPRIEDALARHALVLASRSGPGAPDASPIPPVTDQPAIAAVNTSPPPTTSSTTAPSMTATQPPHAVARTTAPSTTTPPSMTTSSTITSPTTIAPTTTTRPSINTSSTTTAPRTSTPPSTTVTSSPTTPSTASTRSAPPPGASAPPSISSSRGAAPADAAPPTPRSPPTGAELYREAEAALARRDAAAADRALARLLADDPHSPLADQALYERARIAYQRHAWSEARRHLDALATIPTTPLTEPGRYLACRIAVEARDADAARCLAEYRAAYPKSAHDLDVLAMLVQLVHADSGCAGARKLVDELVRLYPASSLARGWHARCEERRQP